MPRVNRIPPRRCLRSSAYRSRSHVGCHRRLLDGRCRCPVIVRFERCSLSRAALCTLVHARTSSGCSAAVAHMLWEPTRGLRRRLRGSERDVPSGEGLDYCAVRERNAGIGRRNGCSASLPAARLNEQRSPRDPCCVRCATRRMVMVDWVTMAAWVAASARRTERSGASGTSSLSSTIEESRSKRHLSDPRTARGWTLLERSRRPSARASSCVPACLMI